MSSQGKKKPCVNQREGKYSHIRIFDPDSGFGPSTEVVNPVIDKHKTGFEWTGTVLHDSSTTEQLSIQLKCTKGTKAKPDKKRIETVPDPGSLTIVLTSGPIVDPVPVDYVDDPGA